MTHKFKIQAGWRLLLTDLGLSPRAVLRRAGLPQDLFGQAQDGLAPAEYFRLWQAVADEHGGADFPLLVAQTASVEAFDPALFAALCSPDFNTAMKRISTYKRLIGPLSCGLEISPEETSLRFDCPGPALLPDVMGVTEIAWTLTLARRATRVPIRPRRVVFREGAPSDPVLEAYFGAPIERGEAFSISLSALDARRPFLTENPQMWHVFEPHLRQRLAELDAAASVKERVRAALLELLPAGSASVHEVSRQLAMSSRSLQRRLRAEGTSFQAVLAGTREELARHYLSNTSMPGAEISFLLGYDTPSSFYRAFHRWTGQTPESMRAATA